MNSPEYKVSLTKHELMKSVTAINTFFACNSIGEQTKLEWLILKEKFAAILLEKFNFKCK